MASDGFQYRALSEHGDDISLQPRGPLAVATVAPEHQEGDGRTKERGHVPGPSVENVGVLRAGASGNKTWPRPASGEWFLSCSLQVLQLDVGRARQCLVNVRWSSRTIIVM